MVRNLTINDLPAAMRLKNEENWNQLENDWKLFLEHNPELCLAATVDGDVIGTVTAINHADRLAWIGMMLVDKNFRGRGISKQLLNTLIARLSSCRTIKLDATPAGNPVYKKLGFKDEFRLLRMTTKDLAFSQGNIDHTEIITQENIQEVAAFDQQVTGVSRLQFLKALMTNFPGKSLLLRQKGQITGTVFVREGHNYTHIGPLFAKDTPTALQLLETTLRHINEKKVLVDVLEDKKELVERLVLKNFEVQRPFIRMFLYKNPAPGKINQQYLISGPEFG